MEVFLGVFLHFELLLRWWFGLLEVGQALSDKALLRLQCFSVFYFQVCQQVELCFVWGCCSYVWFISAGSHFEPAFTGWQGFITVSWLLCPFLEDSWFHGNVFWEWFFNFGGLRNIESSIWEYFSRIFVLFLWKEKRLGIWRFNRSRSIRQNFVQDLSHTLWYCFGWSSGPHRRVCWETIVGWTDTQV